MCARSQVTHANSPERKGCLFLPRPPSCQDTVTDPTTNLPPALGDEEDATESRAHSPPGRASPRDTTTPLPRPLPEPLRPGPPRPALISFRYILYWLRNIKGTVSLHILFLRGENQPLALLTWQMLTLVMKNAQTLGNF